MILPTWLVDDKQENTLCYLDICIHGGKIYLTILIPGYLVDSKIVTQMIIWLFIKNLFEFPDYLVTWCKVTTNIDG